MLLRHGQSTANALGEFTGVLDVPLSSVGVQEARSAARLLREADFIPAVVCTSELMRARRTTGIVTAGREPIEVRRDWRLDERNYGALTGRKKAAVSAEFGAEQFFRWRRTVDAVPPPMGDDQYGKLASTALFRSLPAAALVRTESLRDVIRRVKDFHLQVARPALAAGMNVLVVAHGNSLRALCGVLDDLDDQALEELNIPTGHPLVYRFGEDLRPLVPGGQYLDQTTARAAAIALAHEGGT